MRCSESLRKFQAQAIEKDRLAGIGTSNASDAQLACRAIGGRQHDVGGRDARELGEDRARRVPETRTRLPLLQGLPELFVGPLLDVAAQDVGALREIRSLVPPGVRRPLQPQARVAAVVVFDVSVVSNLDGVPCSSGHVA